MSKPTEKKLARQKQKQQRQKVVAHHPSPIAPPFHAEQFGAPASLFGWLGQKVASFLKLRR